MLITIVPGMQWGDEGKGKIIHRLAPQYDIIGRYGGGPNAGHTVVYDEKKFALHSVPSGIFYEDKISIIGNGCVVHLEKLSNELNELRAEGIPAENLYISKNTHIIMPYHQALDASGEKRLGKNRIGTTGNGIGPAYTDKAKRQGIRIGDLSNPGQLKTKIKSRLESDDVLKALGESGMHADADKYASKQLSFFENLGIKVVDLPYFYQELDEKRGNLRMLCEGAQGTFLDVDYGTYPYATSSNSIASGAYVGLALPPTAPIEKVIGVMKAYCTRVGNGPFPTELGDEKDLKKDFSDSSNEDFLELSRRIRGNCATESEIGRYLRAIGKEKGTTTGRPRRTGWNDIVADRYAILLNGITSIAIMKLDVLDFLPEIRYSIAYKLSGSETEEFLADDLLNCQPVYRSVSGWESEISGKRDYSDLPLNARSYLQILENLLKAPIEIISVGPDKEQTIFKK